MFYNVIVNITRKEVLLCLFLRYLSVCSLYRLSTVVVNVIDGSVVDVMTHVSLLQVLPP